MSELEETFLTYTKWFELPEPIRQYRFHPTRKWRFDFAWLTRKVAVECEGGIWTQGRHVRGSGFMGDVEKYNEATRLGWKVLRVTTTMLEDDPSSFMEMLKGVLSEDSES